MIQSDAIHLGHSLDPTTLDSLADFICGDDSERFPVYRSSSFLTRFFQSIGINAAHDGTTRKWWTLAVLQQLQPSDIEKVILRLTDLREYRADKEELRLALRSMNDILAIENLKVGFEGAKPILKQGTPLSLDEEELLKPSVNEEEFLKQQFSEVINIGDLAIDPVLIPYLQSRVDEIQACPKNKVALGTIFLLGSTLEGLLLAAAVKNPSAFMAASNAPRDRAGKVKKIHEWKLSELIDVSHEIKLLNLDVRKFSHTLRDFRNYIHPYHQMSQSFNPDQHTADICWQVFKAAFSQLKQAGM